MVLELNKEDLAYMSAVDMVEKLKTQEISSLEITELMIERIEKINPIINAFCTPTHDLARETAKYADDLIKKGEPLGPLHGLPISIKDEMPIKGVRTTFGSKLFENHVPEQDDMCVKRLKGAGSVILGKTNMPPFGFWPKTENLIFGKTHNPWKLDRTPGGSSGGAAAAIVSGLGYLALSADGGSSIRTPSSFCGVYGIKPSYGRVPVYPTVGLLSEINIDQYGPIVRYVKDAALMLDVIKGPFEGDKFSLPPENISYLEKINDRPKELKIGYSLNLGFIKAIDPEVEKSFMNSIKKFESFGWTIEESKIKLKKADYVLNLLFSSFLAYDLKSDLEEWRNKLDPNLVRVVDAGYTYSGQDIMKALDIRKSLYAECYEHFKKYDILLTPSNATPAFNSELFFPPKIAGKKSFLTGWFAHLYPFNLTGHPAASIPCGFSTEGLPIGMQIVGKRYDDLSVLQVSKAFEEIAPWQDKKPQFS
ncbi:MAG: amidase [Promethearchaeota archaeon]|nr:MAG: amidase [Candidatus Lokiarchaeota archaeon]